MLKILQKYKFYLLAALVLALAFLPRPEPEQCALCGGLKCHAPCIVDLATGEVGELEIFEPHPTRVGEIAEEQRGGIFAFLPCVGQRAVQDQNARTCTVELPKNRAKMNPRYFCKSCRKLLAGMRGYVLADLYDLSNIRVYPIKDGAVEAIRGYTVTAEWDGTCMKVINSSGF